MRVLMTSPSFDKNGGVSNYCKVVVPYLTCDVRIIVRGSGIKDSSRRASLHLHKIVARLVRDSVKLVMNLKNDIDIIHQNTSLHIQSMIRDAFTLIVTRLFNKPIVVFIHGWDESSAEKLLSWKYRWLLNIYLRATSIVVLSNVFAHHVRNWGFAGNVYVETTPVDNTLVSDTVTNDPGNLFTILFFARVERVKGPHIVVEAVELLQQRGYEVSLVIAGDGSALEETEQLVKSKSIKHVTFTGYVEGQRKVDILRDSHVYVLPTVHGEGLPTTVVEAMAFGLPVITRPVGGLADVMVDGLHGYLTDSVDPIVYADLLEALILSPSTLDDIRQYNRDIACKPFMASEVAKRLDRVYSETIDSYV